MVGSTVSDARPHGKKPPGDVRGFDVRTGEELWAFHSIPEEGEVGVETWEEESWKHNGNANVWTLMSADEELLIKQPNSTLNSVTSISPLVHRPTTGTGDTGPETTFSPKPWSAWMPKREEGLALSNHSPWTVGLGSPGCPQPDRHRG